MDDLTASVEELCAELARLDAERNQLAAERSQLAAEREHYHALYLAALEKVRKLELGLLGQKGQRLPASDAQLSSAIRPSLPSNAASPSTRPCWSSRGPPGSCRPGIRVRHLEKVARGVGLLT